MRDPRSAPRTQASGRSALVTPYRLLQPMLRAGRWIIFLALGTALAFGHHALDLPGVRPALAAALALYAVLSTILLRRRALTPALVVGVAGADLIFVALLVEGTGGIHSPFFEFYYLIVVASAVFYEVRGGLATALAVIVITAAGQWLGARGSILPAASLMLATLLHLFLAAVIAGYLTSQLKREFERHRAAEQAALVLEMERRSAEREMALARQVQQAALPELPAQVEGLEIGVRFRAAGEVGGDFYDFYHRGSEIGLLVGDAGGKGMPAALVGTAALHFFHTQAPATGLAEWCRTFNRELAERTPSFMLATAFCCRVDGLSGQGAWVNAGHPPPVLYRAAPGASLAPILLEGHGMVLGVAEEVDYSEEALALGPGDVLVLYTDGLTEARRPDGRLTGVEPLLGWLPELAPLAAAEIAASIETHLLEIATLRDDLTLLVVKKGTA
jgi:serine phosphatase RsbU (regulator of sigma subunit)